MTALVGAIAGPVRRAGADDGPARRRLLALGQGDASDHARQHHPVLRRDHALHLRELSRSQASSRRRACWLAALVAPAYAAGPVRGLARLRPCEPGGLPPPVLRADRTVGAHQPAAVALGRLARRLMLRRRCAARPSSASAAPRTACRDAGPAASPSRAPLAEDSGRMAQTPKLARPARAQFLAPAVPRGRAAGAAWSCRRALPPPRASFGPRIRASTLAALRRSATG